MKPEEQAHEREGLYARHAEPEEEVGGRGPERQHGEVDVLCARPAQHPREDEHHRKGAGDGGGLGPEPEVADGERRQQHVVEHVVIGEAIRCQDREGEPREGWGKPAHAGFAHHLGVLDVEVRVVSDQIRCRELQPEEHEKGARERTPRETARPQGGVWISGRHPSSLRAPAHRGRGRARMTFPKAPRHPRPAEHAAARSAASARRHQRMMLPRRSQRTQRSSPSHDQ